MRREDFEQEIIRLSEEDLVRLLKQEKLLVSSSKCDKCNNMMKLNNYYKVVDGLSWQCLKSCCENYKKRLNIRTGSFFEGFRLPFLLIIRILYKWSLNQSQESIISALIINSRTYKKVLNKFLNLIKINEIDNITLGGEGKLVQIDETALNHGVKSHRGRSATNKTDALCIVEYDFMITRAFACIIPDKKATTMIPIICSKVLPHSTIWTDEHRSYSKLNELNYSHSTVCHKREFIDNETGVNTQAVESFNNAVKLEIKKRKRIKTTCRANFLDEFTWLFNNRNLRFKSIWEILKIKS